MNIAAFMIGLIVSVLTCQPQARSADPSEMWDRIQSLRHADKSGTESTKYMESLTAQEVLALTRYICETIVPQYEDQQRVSAALSSGNFLSFYIDKFPPDVAATTLLAIAGDQNEPDWLRLTIISLLESYPSDGAWPAFHEYVLSHLDPVQRLLQGIIADREGDPELRSRSMSALKSLWWDRVRRVVITDDSYKEAKKQTTDVLPVGKLVRSGELKFTDTTLAALKPMEEPVGAAATLLAKIVADENEPKELRERARLFLRSYADLPIVLTPEVEKAATESP